MTRTQFIEKLFDRAKNAGFSACEVYWAGGSSFSVSVFNGEITDYSSADAMGLSFRGMINGKMGYASTQALDEEAIDILVDGAKGNAELIECADEQFLFAGSADYQVVENYNAAIDEIPASEKISLCKALEQHVLRSDKRIRQVGGCSVFSDSSEIEIVNTLGLNVHHRANLIGGYVEPVASDGEHTNTGFSVFFENDPTKLDIEETARKAVREALDGLEASSVPSGAYRVLLRNDCAASLLATFSGIFSADRAQKGLSLLNGRENETIAASCLTILDDPHLAGQAASSPFDAEGVATWKKKIVDAGVLKTLLHNLKTANKQGIQTTANAAKGSYSSSVAIAPTNFLIEPSAIAPDAMLQKLADGLLITELQGQHAGADAISGDFSLSAKGYLVENGKIGRAVNQTTVAGNFFALLKDIEAVGSDLKFGFPGASTFASPSLLINSLSIAGK